MDQKIHASLCKHHKAMSPNDTGYRDTPALPHVDYLVHDADRPRPNAVGPNGAVTVDGGGAPPLDATVLLGDSLDGWEHPNGEPATWNIGDGYVEVAPGSGDIRTQRSFGDCQLHIEWATPSEVTGESQGRGNSGVFLMDRYEIQVLDTYENPTYADGYAGAVYGQHPPLVNACLPPGTWQSYDIIWHAPRFKNGNLDRPARVTVLHNGVLVQDDSELIGATTHQAVGSYDPHEAAAPLRLQDHGDLVRYRNIWYRPL